mgnify:CR=1 FL=1
MKYIAISKLVCTAMTKPKPYSYKPPSMCKIKRVKDVREGRALCWLHLKKFDKEKFEINRLLNEFHKLSIALEPKNIDLTGHDTWSEKNNRRWKLRSEWHELEKQVCLLYTSPSPRDRG